MLCVTRAVCSDTEASKQPQEYGIFVDIGLGRMDALMPNAMLGDVAPA